MCTVVGVGVGTALSVQRKNAKYLALGGFAGTVADAAYSFGYLCRDLQLEYSAARSQAYKMSKEEESWNWNMSVIICTFTEFSFSEILSKNTKHKTHEKRNLKNR